jgi:DNA modification methylase
MAMAERKDPEDFWTLHQGDARDLDDLLRARSSAAKPLLGLTVTSPPYGDLKDYGEDGQIGHGQPYADYLAEMEAIFATLHIHTKNDGSLWLIADTYVAKGRAPRALRPLPFDLAAVAEAAGWTLRDVIIWRKDRTLPWSNGTRLRNAFEYVLLLVKGPHPKYRLDRLREHGEQKGWWVRFPERYSPAGKAPSNVWEIPIPMQGSWGNGELEHACPLPAELVERLVLLSSDEGDVVLDPFAGSGVVVAEAERLGRRGVGVELVGRHVEEFRRIIRPEILARESTSNGNGNGNGNRNGNGANAQLLINLRMLKLPVVLMRAAARRRGAITWPLGVLVLPVPGPPSAGRHARVRLHFIVEGADADEREAYEALLNELAGKKPASKFGIDAEIRVEDVGGLQRLVTGRRIHLYRNGATSRAVEAVRHSGLVAALASGAVDSVPAVLSSIHVDVAPRPEAVLRGVSAPVADT